MPKPRYTDIVLDPGHGGIDPATGRYTTAPSKMYEFRYDTDGTKLPEPLVHYEGQWVRWGAAMLAVMLKGSGVRVHSTVNQRELDWADLRHDGTGFNHVDVSLVDRVKYADKVTREARARGGDALVLSRHTNAVQAPEGRRGYSQPARGISVFTFVGQSGSDDVASSLYIAYQQSTDLPVPVRRGDLSDGDPDHEARFYILRETDCHAVLVEGGFHTNIEDVRRLQTLEGQAAMARAEFIGLLPFLALPRDSSRLV